MSVTPIEATASDAAAILAHVHSIFAAYIRKDRVTIRDSHSPDWTGFQNPSTGIERGLDAYMKNAELSLRELSGVGYELIDTELQVLGDLGLLYYVARYDYLDAQGARRSVPLRALDVYRREPSGWIQCGSHVAVIPGEPTWTHAAGATAR